MTFSSYYSHYFNPWYIIIFYYSFAYYLISYIFTRGIKDLFEFRKYCYKEQELICLKRAWWFAQKVPLNAMQLKRCTHIHCSLDICLHVCCRVAVCRPTYTIIYSINIIKRILYTRLQSANPPPPSFQPTTSSLSSWGPLQLACIGQIFI